MPVSEVVPTNQDEEAAIFESPPIIIKVNPDMTLAGQGTPWGISMNIP